MSKVDERLIVNEVIVVGRVRLGQENVQMPKAANGDALPFGDETLKAAVKGKFTFLNDTRPDGAAQAAGFQSGKYLQLRLRDPGGEIATLHNGKQVKLSSKTNKYAWRNIFKSQQGITYDDIADEIIAGNFEVVGTGNEGQIKLTKYGLMGYWDEWSLGFGYTQHQRDASGKYVPMISHVRDRLTGKFGDKPAIGFTGRQFVLEGEIGNITGMREAFAKSVEQWKVVVTATESGSPDGAAVDTKVASPADTAAARDAI
jgi:hypothetical protein